MLKYDTRKKYDKIIADTSQYSEYRYTENTASNCRVIYRLNTKLKNMPPTEKQLKQLEKLQLKCMMYGIPCKMEFRMARTNRYNALITIYKIRKRLEVEE